jgi:hypothetical protein
MTHHRLKSIEHDSELQQQLSPVSNAPELGPLCHELLHPRTSKRIGWFLPDTNEALLSDIFCLGVDVRFPDSKHRQQGGHRFRIETNDARPPEITRGLVLAAQGPDVQVGPSRRTGTCTGRQTYSLRYFELDYNVTGEVVTEVAGYVTVVGL